MQNLFSLSLSLIKDTEEYTRVVFAKTEKRQKIA
jgi:hypothetical protein